MIKRLIELLSDLSEDDTQFSLKLKLECDQIVALDNLDNLELDEEMIKLIYSKLEKVKIAGGQHNFFGGICNNMSRLRPVEVSVEEDDYV